MRNGFQPLCKRTVGLSHGRKGPKEARNAFNGLLSESLKRLMAMSDMNTPVQDQDLTALMNAFLADYEEFMSEDPAFVMPWSIEVEGQVLFENKHLISVALHQYTYTGGAHPNTYTSIYMMDKENGKPLQLVDLQTASDTLLAIAEAAFRTEVEIGPEESLAEAGFFEGEDFHLPANYALVEEGLMLYYNTYEIAPYVFGATEVLIPRANLAPALAIEKWY